MVYTPDWNSGRTSAPASLERESLLARLIAGCGLIALLVCALYLASSGQARLGLIQLLIGLGLLATLFYLGRVERRLRLRSHQLYRTVRELRAQQAELQHLAHHDPLTGLANRTLLRQRLEQALALAERHQTRLGVLFLDLNDFKPINDRHGHRVGDAVLREVGRRLTGTLRDSDTVARIGGDEFMVIINDVENQAAARSAADKLVSVVEQPFCIDGQMLPLTVSVGLSVYPDHDSDLETLMSLADLDMYRIKDATRRSRYAHRFAARTTAVPQGEDSAPQGGH